LKTRILEGNYQDARDIMLQNLDNKEYQDIMYYYLFNFSLSLGQKKDALLYYNHFIAFESEDLDYWFSVLEQINRNYSKISQN
jgi:hypothetical protein